MISQKLKTTQRPGREQELRPRPLASAVPVASMASAAAVAPAELAPPAPLALASPALLALGTRQTLRLEVPELASLAAPCGGATR